MTSQSSEPWSPTYGTTTFTTSMSPTRSSFSTNSDTHRQSSTSDEADSATQMRRITVSPSPHSDDDSYDEENSIDEVEATLNTLDDELDDTEQALSSWSSRSPYTSASGTFTGTYTGSPSYMSLPSILVPLPPSPLGLGDPRMRLSRITEHTEPQSRPTTDYSIQSSRADIPLRRPAFMSGRESPALGHTRSTTDPGGDRELPPPGRTNQLIAVFETNSPGPSHERTTSAPGLSISRPTSPYYSGTYTSGSYSRPSSPTKPGSSWTPQPSTLSTFLSPARPSASSDTRPSITTGESTFTPSAFTSTSFSTATRTQPTESRTESMTPTRSPPSTLRRPQASPRSPLASVRNIVALWKERTPTRVKETEREKSPSPPDVSRDDGGLFDIRRRASARFASHRREDSGDGGRESTNSSSVGIPPSLGMEMGELSRFVGGTEPPLHLGTLFYLNVHTGPPYLWQRCQALLYPHTLLLSWMAPGAGRGVVQLDLINCSAVESALSLGHPRAQDDIGTIAAHSQDSSGGGDLVNTLVPFWMLYADGVERLACESLVERQKWVHTIWEAINNPPSSAGGPRRSRSPTGSIRTILSVSSQSSVNSRTSTGTGSRSTVFVPPISDVPDIEDLYGTDSETGITRRNGSISSALYETASSSSRGLRTSLLSSFNTHTVDDTAISGQDYVYHGDRRVIGGRRLSQRLRRSGSMTDMGSEFSSNQSSGKSGDDKFYSAESSQNGSQPRSSYYSTTFTPSSMYLSSASPGTYTATNITSRIPGLSSTSSPRGSTSASLLGDSHSGSYSYSSSYIYGSASPYTSTLSYETGSYSSSPLSRTREVRRRGGSSSRSNRSFSSGYTSSREGVSEKENDTSDVTPQSGTNGSGTGTYTHLTRSSETGYDVCPSSDLSGLTSWTPTQVSSSTPISSGSSVEESVAESVKSDTSEKNYVTASSGSEAYDTAASPSEASFKSLPTIPSIYSSALEGSGTYHTASDRTSTEHASTEYSTAEVCPSELEDIPSEQSTPRASVIDFESQESIVKVPTMTDFPSISSPSTVSSILPEDIPLPPSVAGSVISSSISSVTESLTPSTMSSVPSPIQVSTDISSDVPTPSSLHLTPTELPSSLPSTATVTETRTESYIPSAPPTAAPPSVAGSISISSVTSISGSSLQVPPPEPETNQQWDIESNLSYESSLLAPSPSVRSLALPDALNNSFETSYLRPSASVSSLDRMSTIPGTATAPSTRYLPSPYPSLLPVHSEPVSRPPSVMATPTSLLLSSQSSLSRTPSSVSSSSTSSRTSGSSSVSESSSIIPSSIGEPQGEGSVDVSTVTTHISSTPTIPPLPIPPPSITSTPSTPARSVNTPTASISVSVSTPRGIASSQRDSLRSEPLPSIPSSVSEGDEDMVAIALGRLADDIRQYDSSRATENRGLEDTLGNLRNELRELANYIERPQQPQQPPQRQPPEERLGYRSRAASSVMSDRRSLVEEAVGSSRPVSETDHISVDAFRTLTLTRSSSNASSISFLSSHHSEDWELYGEGRPPSPIPELIEHGASDVVSDISSSSESYPVLESQSSESSIVSPASAVSPVSPISTTLSSASSPPSSPSATSSSLSTVVPRRVPQDPTVILNAVREQIGALWDGQLSTNHMLDELRGRTAPDSSELLRRMNDIQDILETLQNMPRTEPRTEPSQPSQPRSVTETETSSTEEETAEMSASPQLSAPVPTLPTGPSLADQLDQLISATRFPRRRSVHGPPPLQPFIYVPSRGRRQESISPVRSVSEPPQMSTTYLVPPFFPPPRGQQSPQADSRPPTTTQDATTTRPDSRPPGDNDIDFQREQRRLRRQHDPDTDGFYGPRHRSTTPAMRPFPETDRPHTTPPTDRREPWYRPQGQPPTQGPPIRTTSRIPYLPLPPPPILQSDQTRPPDIFESILSILRENRLAQLATVEQQRELMRYMRGLNEWLERDVRDRQDELQSVVARIDTLRNEVHNMPRQGGGMPPSDDSSTESDETGSPVERPGVFGHQMPVFGPQIPQPAQPTAPVQPIPPGFVPFPHTNRIPGRLSPSPPTHGFIPPDSLQEGGFIPPGQVGPHVIINGPPPIQQGFPPQFPIPMVPGGPGGPFSTTEPFVPHLQTDPLPHSPVFLGESESSPSSSSAGISGGGSRRPSRDSSRHRHTSSPSPTQVPLSSSVHPVGPPPPIVHVDPQIPGVLPVPYSGRPALSELRPGSPRHPDVPFTAPQPPPQQGSTIIIQPPGPQQPYPGGPGMQGVPMQGMPMQGMPMQGMPMPIPPTQIVRTSSSSGSSRSPSRRHSRSPIILPGISSQRSTTPAPIAPIVYTAPPPSAPAREPIIISHPRSSSRSSRSPRSRTSHRSHSRSPDIITMQPPAPTGPMPSVIIPSAAPAPGPIYIPQRTHSRSSRGQTPVVLQPGTSFPPVQPAYPSRPGEVPYTRHGSRSRSPRSSHSRSPRSHHTVQPIAVPGGSYYDPHHEHRRPSGSYSPVHHRPPTHVSRSPSRDRTRHDSTSRPHSRHSPSGAHSRRSPSPVHSQYAPSQTHYSAPSRRPTERRPHSPRSSRSSRSSNSLSPSRHGRTASDRLGERRSSQRPQEHRPESPPFERHPSVTRPVHMAASEYDDDAPRPVPYGGTHPPYSGSRPPTAIDVIPVVPTEHSHRGRSEAPRSTRSQQPMSPRSATPVRSVGDDDGRSYRTPSIVSQRRSPAALSYRPSTTRSRIEDDVPPGRTRPGEQYEPSGPSRASGPHNVETQRDESAALPVPPAGPETYRRVGTPGQDVRLAEDDRARDERLAEVEDRLHVIADSAETAEDRREAEFRENEEARQRAFLDNEDRRNEQTEQARGALLHDIEERIEGRLGAIPEPPEPADDAVLDQEAAASPRPADVESMMSATHDAISQHVSDVIDTIRSEREAMAQEREEHAVERERRQNELDEERARAAEERENRIKSLEEELARVREELANEKQQRISEEAEARERERAEFVERDEALRAQLNDITQLVNGQRENNWDEIRELVQQIRNDLATEVAQASEARIQAAARGTLDDVITELRNHNTEQQDMLRTFTEDWMASCTRKHEETIEAVKSTAHEQVPFNVQGYLDEFSKALASEVRILLGEVGKLREERRNLQHEIGYLLCTKSKYGPGGEFDPEWSPAAPPPPPAEAGPPPPPPAPHEIPQARPAWRTAAPPRTRKPRKKEQAPAPAAAMPDPRTQVQSWNRWQMDPRFAPTPPPVPATLVVPETPSPGLFGPRSPRSMQNSIRG